MLITPYEEVKRYMGVGDLIVWRGEGGNFLERMYSIGIKLTTGPVTHCATVCHLRMTDDWMPFLWESAAQGQVFDSFDRRIAMAAKEGYTHCWWVPLSKSRREKLDALTMMEYMQRKVEEGTAYDIQQAIRSAFDGRRRRSKNRLDDSSLFCSESHMFALMQGGAVKNCNASEAHPSDVVSFKMHAPEYHQIWFRDRPMMLRHYNRVNPEGWDA